MSLEKNNSHLAGEYFVAAELYRKGYSVGMTIGNAKSVDILAHKDGKNFSIQVKAIKDKKSVGWPMMKEKVEMDVFYVFVNLNGETQSPDYYVCTGKEAKEKVKQYATRGIVDLNTLKSDLNKYYLRWDKIS